MKVANRLDAGSDCRRSSATVCPLATMAKITIGAASSFGNEPASLAHPKAIRRARHRRARRSTEAGRRDHAVKPEVVECIVQMALSPPPAGRPRWTTRLIGDEVDL